MLRYLLILSFATNMMASPDKKASRFLELKKDPIANKMTRILSKKDQEKLKKLILSQGSKSIQSLVYVLKNESFPIENRWSSLFLLGQIMGEKSIPFISKYAQHSNWMLRLASLKTLILLKSREHKVYAKLLKDKAMIVRFQAIEAVKKLKITSLAPNIWAMLYDEKNYFKSQGLRKRSELIKRAITTIGDLEFKPAQRPLLKMIKKSSYHDLVKELDYSLSKISQKKSPAGSLQAKKIFWSHQRI